jgi:hypothetical protein
MQLRRADTSLSDDTELANVTYNDKYVVVYNFNNTGSSFMQDRSVSWELMS